MGGKMKKRSIVVLYMAVLFAVAVVAVCLSGCKKSNEEKEIPVSINPMTVFDNASETYAAEEWYGKATGTYTENTEVGGETGDFLKITYTSKEGGKSGFDFVFEPAFEKSHYETLESQGKDYVVTLRFYVEMVSFDEVEEDGTTTVVGPYMWGSIFGIAETQWGYPQKSTGWYTYSIPLASFIEEYDNIVKLYTGRKLSTDKYCIMHIWTNVDMEFNIYFEDIVVEEGIASKPTNTPQSLKETFVIVQPWTIGQNADDISVVATEVNEFKDENGPFIKYDITWNKTGNLKLGLKYIPEHDYYTYNEILKEYPNAKVRFYLYVDSSQVKNGQGWSMNMDMFIASPMFGVEETDDSNDAGLGTEYEYIREMTLSSWLELNYPQGYWQNKFLYVFAADDQPEQASVLKIYSKVEIIEDEQFVENDVFDKISFSVTEKWTVGQDDISTKYETVDEVNGKDGDFLVAIVTWMKDGNSVFSLKAMPAESYQYYQAIAEENTDLQIRFSVYVDASGVTKADGTPMLMNNQISSPVFGQTIRSGIDASLGAFYEYSKTMLLSEWIGLNFSSGIWMNKDLFTLSGNDAPKAGSVLKLYVQAELIGTAE